LNQFTTDYVGLDVHKDSVDISIASGSESGEVRHVGKVDGDLHAIDRALERLAKAGRVLKVVYEAGPCGFVLQRYLASKGIDCEVVAPSLIPRRSGQRIKTDRRDSLQLARLARARELTPVRVPQPEDEAMRDLVRAREDAMREQRNARHRLKALLLRNGIRYTGGKKSWTKAHERWLGELKLPHAAQQIAFQEYVHSIAESSARIERLEQALRNALAGWSHVPVVMALQALRGIQLLAAMTLVVEIQDFHRFSHPRRLMAYLGLVPSEHSSGQHRHQGGITKSGNRAARRILVEIAHHYRHHARVSDTIARRQADLPKAVTDIAWAAQLRLCGRYRKLRARGVLPNKVAVAIAREMVGFVWAIARQVNGLPAGTRRVAA